MRTLVRNLVATAAVAATVLGGASSASADGVDDELGLPAGVQIDEGLEDYLEGLSQADRSEFIATKLPNSIEIVEGEQLPADNTAAATLKEAVNSGTEITPLATGCWHVKVTGKSTATAGNVLYTFWTVGQWCASGTKVTSAKVLDADGETSTPGWRYEGVTKKDSGVVSNQGRSYSKHRFVLGAGGWDVQTTTPCLRIAGKASSSYTASYTCGIY